MGGIDRGFKERGMKNNAHDVEEHLVEGYDEPIESLSKLLSDNADALRDVRAIFFLPGDLPTLLAVFYDSIEPFASVKGVPLSVSSSTPAQRSLKEMFEHKFECLKDLRAILYDEAEGVVLVDHLGEPHQIVHLELDRNRRTGSPLYSIPSDRHRESTIKSFLDSCIPSDCNLCHYLAKNLLKYPASPR